LYNFDYTNKVKNIKLVELNDINKFDVYIVGANNPQVNNLLKKIRFSPQRKKILIPLFNDKFTFKKNKNLSLINL
jgi:hypothetical protein